jgi:hypothetical protein
VEVGLSCDDGVDGKIVSLEFPELIPHLVTRTSALIPGGFHISLVNLTVNENAIIQLFFIILNVSKGKHLGPSQEATFKQVLFASRWQQV